MRKIVWSLIAVAGLISCSKSDNILNPKNPNNSSEQSEGEKSMKGMIQYIGGVQMEEGPHDLLINATSLYAVRDNKVFQFQIQNPANPILQKEYTIGNGADRFGKLYYTDGKLYLPCQTDGYLYEFGQGLSLLKKYDLIIASFKPNTIIKDKEGNFWIGGSNGSKGILAKYSFQNGNLVLREHWTALGNNSNIESMIEKDDYIIVSIPNGDLYSFLKSDVAIGPINTVTYTHEAGHEKWGHTLIRKGNTAFWANWGAGFAAVDIADPANMSISKVLTNSSFKSQFSGAEGTNVYDVVYNAKKDMLCVANGWSGVVLIKPSSPDQVLDYIDPTYFQNRCIETHEDYIYTGNISGGMSGDMKGIKVFKLNM